VRCSNSCAPPGASARRASANLEPEAVGDDAETTAAGERTPARSSVFADRGAPEGGLRGAIDGWSAAEGFSVTWHGDPDAEAPPASLDALVRALAECLQNVKRHSGVLQAEVTISQDERSVRAVVTDTGVGFDRELVPRGRLGLVESVEARIREVGGAARVFSSPGRGTTVLIEVPR
jgi:signal transduction histidine kinase